MVDTFIQVLVSGGGEMGFKQSIIVKGFFSILNENTSTVQVQLYGPKAFIFTHISNIYRFSFHFCAVFTSCK